MLDAAFGGGSSVPDPLMYTSTHRVSALCCRHQLPRRGQAPRTPLRAGRVARAAFTLIEMLAVIGIIAILAGMVFGGVTVAKRSALKTKSVSLLQQVSQALNSYRTLNGSYPESYPDPAYSPDRYSSFKSDWNSTSSAAYRSATDVAIRWDLINETFVLQLAASGESLSGRVKDAWGKPLCYRPAKFYPFDDSRPLPIAIDRDTGVPCRDSFQLWSTGPNGVNDGAADTSDDLPAWK